MDHASESPRLSPAATMRYLQNLAREQDLDLSPYAGDLGNRAGLRSLAAASSLYVDDFDRDIEVIDLSDTKLPDVAPEMVFGVIPSVGSSTQS